MKIAIISDTHFGDTECTLVQRKGNQNKIQAGERFEDFLNAAGTQNDYLVMAGDIFDFSVTSYDKAYAYAKVFFTLIKEYDVAKEIIYIPGNHDADMWHIIQQQRAVINRLNDGELPRSYKHAIPGVLNTRDGVAKRDRFLLHGVTAGTKKGKAKYGGMFLDKITGKTQAKQTVFNFVYPNLYIVTETETVLVTHGQYLEPAWSFLGELLLEIVDGDLGVGGVDIEDMMQLNFPISQLLCTGVGQAGLVTDNLVRPLEQDVKRKDFTKIDKYLRRLEKFADSRMGAKGWWPTSVAKEFATDQFLSGVRKMIYKAVSTLEETRYRTDFTTERVVQQRFSKYYKACLAEISVVNRIFERESGKRLFSAVPDRIIFGHTHDPIAWDDPKAPKLTEHMDTSLIRPVTLHNAGGWLHAEGKPFGAEVFKFEDGKGFSSVRVR